MPCGKSHSKFRSSRPKMHRAPRPVAPDQAGERSEEHTSELQSRFDLVCRLLLEKKKLFKRHAALIRRPSAGFCGVWRRHILHYVDSVRELPKSPAAFQEAGENKSDRTS